MIVAAIVACEIGFWVVLGAGLMARYMLRLRRTGAVLLTGVPLVDLALLGFTVVDLRRGTPAELAHGLAAVYLGFSVAFGHAMVRWADVRAAQRFAGGPAPAPKPYSGTWARARHEWREFAKAGLAVGISSALLLGGVLLVGDRSDTAALEAWLPRLGLALVAWLVAWPVWESVRAAFLRLPDG
ncbi:MAG: hypothetical protein WAL50_01345 [Kineosporiaceae bacterium]